MSEPIPAEIALAWQAAANQQDIDQLLRLSDPQIELVGPRGVGVGHAVLRDWLAHAGLTLTSGRVFGRGAVVVLAQHGVWQAVETGAMVEERDVATCYWVAAGRVTRLARHETLAAALAAGGLTMMDEIPAA